MEEWTHLSLGMVIWALVAVFLSVPGTLVAQDAEIDLNWDTVNRIEVNGTVNSAVYQRSFEDSGGQEDQSEFAVNEAIFGVSTALGRYVDVKTQFLYEEIAERRSLSSPGSVDIEQMYFVLADNPDFLLERDGEQGNNPFYLKVGRVASPFGVNLASKGLANISEPQTAVLGEIIQSSLMAGYAPDYMPVHLFGGVFRGDESEGPDGDNSHLQDYYVGADVKLGPTDWSLQYTNAITGARLLSDRIGPTSGETTVVDRTGAVNAFGSLDLGPTTLQGEWIRATDTIDGDDFDNTGVSGEELRPMAISSKWTLHGKDMGLPVNLTAQYENTDDLPGQPDDQYGLVVDRNVLEGAVNLAVQYYQREFDQSLTSASLDEESFLGAQMSVNWGMDIANNG